MPLVEPLLLLIAGINKHKEQLDYTFWKDQCKCIILHIKDDIGESIKKIFKRTLKMQQKKFLVLVNRHIIKLS